MWYPIPDLRIPINETFCRTAVTDHKRMLLIIVIGTQGVKTDGSPVSLLPEEEYSKAKTPGAFWSRNTPDEQ